MSWFQVNLLYWFIFFSSSQLHIILPSHFIVSVLHLERDSVRLYIMNVKKPWVCNLTHWFWWHGFSNTSTWGCLVHLIPVVLSGFFHSVNEQQSKQWRWKKVVSVMSQLEFPWKCSDLNRCAVFSGKSSPLLSSYYNTTFKFIKLSVTL